MTIGSICLQPVGWAKRSVPTRPHHPASPALFAKRSLNVARIAAPIDRENPFRDETVEGAMRPLAHPRHEPMFHRVEMDVVHVAFQIGVVADGMLPIATLPQPTFSLRGFARRAARLLGQSSRETCLQDAPTRRVIGITCWHRPNCMQMVRQNTNRDRLERITRLDHPIDPAQFINVLYQQIARSVSERDREKEHTAFDFGATISGHRGIPLAAIRGAGTKRWARFALPTLQSGAAA